MTHEEIRLSYNQAKDKRQQVDILAQLNDLPVSKILDIVHSPSNDTQQWNQLLKTTVRFSKDGFISYTCPKCNHISCRVYGKMPNKISSATQCIWCGARIKLIEEIIRRIV